MRIPSAIVLVLCAARGAVHPAPFTEPKAHPISRYEAGWQKNPFTLKTAPVAVIKESFAKDLALAGLRQAGDDNLVILVNTKTREFTRLKNQEPAADGTKVKSVHLAQRRLENYVELERNNETATVRFDEGYLKTMAAQQASPQKPNPQVAMRAPNLPGQGPPTGMNLNPATAGQSPIGTAPNITPPGVPGSRPSIVPPVANAPATNLPGGAPANIPTIQRRRLNTLPQPPQR